LKLKCDVLRKHVITCTQRLDEFNAQNHRELKTDKQIQKYRIIIKKNSLFSTDLFYRNTSHQDESNNQVSLINEDYLLIRSIF